MKRVVALALVLALARAVEAAEESYTLDGSHSAPMFEISHMGMSLQRGFFTDVQGTIRIDRAARTGSIEVVVDTASVTTSSRLLTGILKRADYFDVEKYPAMRYSSREIVFEGDVPVAAKGSLTLLGVTRPVPLSISSFRCGTHPLLRRAMCAAEVTASIRRSDFGMTGGLPDAAGDEVRIVVPVEAIGE